jgi:hypothetical protein
MIIKQCLRRERRTFLVKRRMFSYRRRPVVWGLQQVALALRKLQRGRELGDDDDPALPEEGGCSSSDLPLDLLERWWRSLMVVGITQRMRGRREGEETTSTQTSSQTFRGEKTINSDDLNMRVIQVQADFSFIIGSFK